MLNPKILPPFSENTTPLFLSYRYYNIYKYYRNFGRTCKVFKIKEL